MGCRASKDTSGMVEIPANKPQAGWPIMRGCKAMKEQKLKMVLTKNGLQDPWHQQRCELDANLWHPTTCAPRLERRVLYTQRRSCSCQLLVDGTGDALTEGVKACRDKQARSTGSCIHSLPEKAEYLEIAMEYIVSEETLGVVAPNPNTTALLQPDRLDDLGNASQVTLHAAF